MKKNSGDALTTYACIVVVQGIMPSSAPNKSKRTIAMTAEGAQIQHQSQISDQLDSVTQPLFSLAQGEEVAYSAERFSRLTGSGCFPSGRKLASCSSCATF
ncbi:Hypothetical predicted protein [Pelobates cultripes]|uniref:Uncharacterized protein n=1 Tax=Pelobates cultripes TaxID=61616 RepID=A0AAD1TJN3_PELCU|nr:Hypothetical predicted protein [Pelobates cultripes]